MGKKTASQILRDCEERAKFLDKLAQTVNTFISPKNGDRFDYATKDSINDEVVSAINNLKTIEEELMGRLGLSYTNTPYTRFDYIVKSPGRQFNTLTEIQSYYSPLIARMRMSMEEENAVDGFINDGLGQGTNEVVPPSTNPRPVGSGSREITDKADAMGGTNWADAEAAIIASLDTINSALMGDIPNIS
jgi:hypothetical protein